ncbi:MAG TPA: GNAT family N-acetyltransferase [Saprospiraceae bacterium]|nr:GNAT family N-acetyltransferase [Saprospiraceae bacterium]HMQ83549.1 GNAT family N-acetyltransferase [Saprospiraceae bacterium]
MRANVSEPTLQNCTFNTLTHRFRWNRPLESVEVIQKTNMEFPLHVLGQNIQFALFHSAYDLPNAWEEVLQDTQQMMLSRRYLQTFELDPPTDMKFAYLLFFQEGKAIGVAACQLITFRAYEQIQSLQQVPQGSFWAKSWHNLKTFFAKKINYHLLVCGATQFTGEHAFYFSNNNPSEQQFSWIEQALDKTCKLLRQNGWRVMGVLLKDFYRHEEHPEKVFLSKGYHELRFQPNMVLSLPKEWKNFDDYLAAMTSKYRVRVRRAIKKGDAIVRHTLAGSEVEQWSEKLYALHRKVVSGADFSMVTLHPNYLLNMQRAFPQHFRIHAYFLKEELIGFLTSLQNGNDLEAHCIGFDHQYNNDYQLYLNMLYDMVKTGLDLNARQIIFERTALEIKSSMGAVPKDMYLYLKSRNKLINFFLPYFVHQLEPKQEWLQRHPFGHED